MKMIHIDIMHGGKMNLDKIAKEIVEYDFSEVPYDETDEACYNLATDLYNCNNEQANEIVSIIMNKYINLIK